MRQEGYNLRERCVSRVRNLVGQTIYPISHCHYLIEIEM